MHKHPDGYSGITSSTNDWHEFEFGGICMHKIAVVLPCHNCREHILGVIKKIGPEVSYIFVVDDKCPQKTGDYVYANNNDERVIVVHHHVNRGVGGAVMTGYRAAIHQGADVIVKVDGDGQMNPALIPFFVHPIIHGHADYTKGNRFYDLENVKAMPGIRLFGNAVLSFITKLSSGYWDVFDPTNGYTAIHANMASHLPYKKINQRYFFESDMLFRLNTLDAVVLDIPMEAVYGDEVSGLKISKIVPEFLACNIKNFLKRIFYKYYLRGMTAASLELPLGLTMLLGGMLFGLIKWHYYAKLNAATPLGTIMVAALPMIFGIQLMMSVIDSDVSSVPKISKSKTLIRNSDITIF